MDEATKSKKKPLGFGDKVSKAGCCRGECKSVKNFKWKYKEE